MASAAASRGVPAYTIGSRGTGADRVIAGREPEVCGGRKVRAPQGRVVGNAHRPRGQGKCNRKETASGGNSGGKGETVR